MTDRTALGGNNPSLGDLVHCANCGTAMGHTDQLYYCPNAAGNSGRDCPTNPVGTQLLLHTVFSTLINRFATDDTIDYATRVIKATTEPRANALRQQMESYEEALADANVQDAMEFQLAENRTKFYPDTAAEIGAMDQLAAKRARDSLQPGTNWTRSHSSPTKRASETTPPIRQPSWKRDVGIPTRRKVVF